MIDDRRPCNSCGAPVQVRGWRKCEACRKRRRNIGTIRRPLSFEQDCYLLGEVGPHVLSESEDDYGEESAP